MRALLPLVLGDGHGDTPPGESARGPNRWSCCQEPAAAERFGDATLDSAWAIRGSTLKGCVGLAIAEANRCPFDMPEGESEIVAGHMVEYSGMAYAQFMLAEYSNMILIAFLTAIMFFGGIRKSPCPNCHDHHKHCCAQYAHGFYSAHIHYYNADAQNKT